MKWSRGFPAPLAVYAVVPLHGGGLASVQRCRTAGFLRDVDLGGFGVDKDELRAALSSIGVLCAADARADVVDFHENNGQVPQIVQVWPADLHSTHGLLKQMQRLAGQHDFQQDGKGTYSCMILELLRIAFAAAKERHR